MKDEYHFANAEKGKFHRPMEELRIPIYLEEDVLSYLRGKKGDADLSSMVNEIVRLVSTKDWIPAQKRRGNDDPSVVEMVS